MTEPTESTPPESEPVELSGSLAELAEHAGISLSYADIWGKKHPASEEVLRALLTAMGFDADDETAAERAAGDALRAEWDRLVPDVVVARAEKQPDTLPLRTPKDESGTAQLSVQLESGETRTSSVALEELDVDGEQELADGVRVERSLPLPDGLPLGYHQLTVTLGQRSETCRLIVAPKSCVGPGEQRLWGITAQLYGVRGSRDSGTWGIGDFGDLAELAERAAREGASFVGVNPLHPLFIGNPAHTSPYSPSSRAGLNPVYIDVHAVPGRDAAEQRGMLNDIELLDERLHYLRGCDTVDYSAVVAAKLSILEPIYRAFVEVKVREGGELAREFERFREEGGEHLRRFAIFEAAYEYFSRERDTFVWSEWPDAFRSPDSGEVRAFAEQHADRVRFHEYLQWVADRQLAGVARRARAAGMSMGLYLDVAVGLDPGGADAWGAPGLTVPEVALGAPPDLLNQLGQDWGLVPLNPVALRSSGFEQLVRVLRANMAHAGAIRIDHIMGLLRQFWIPRRLADGRTPEPSEGAYVSFPVDDIFRVLALESQRNRCVVVGEDLGTVPDGFRERMAEAGVLSYRVLYFERWEDGLFKRPDAYPAECMAVVSTHDLPTIAGWWEGHDIDWRVKLKLYPDDESRDADPKQRATDRSMLADALADSKQLSAEERAALNTEAPGSVPPSIVEAAHGHLAASDAALMGVQLEDLAGSREQANVPGTTDQHPNWRRRASATVPELFDAPSARGILERVVRVRGTKAPRNDS